MMLLSLPRLGPSGLTASLGMILVAGFIGLGGCAPQNPGVDEVELRQREAGSLVRLATADLGMVDCLLPPRIRRLGTQSVYLEPARRMETTYRDCAVRGGDIIAHDPARNAT